MKKGIFLMGVLFFTTLSFALNMSLVWAEYPDRKIRLISPFEAGGGTDLTARILARYANPYLSDRIYVENVVGAGGAIGFREGGKSPPDGYTLTMVPNSIFTGPLMVKDFPTVDLFDFICVVMKDPNTLTVKLDSRFKTGADLISYAKANPGNVSIGTAGFASYSHLILVAFEEAIGTKFNMVPYKGAGPAQVAAVGGHVDGAISGFSEAFSLVDGKKLRYLMILGDNRHQSFPEVRTAKELGYDLVFYNFNSIAVPKGTPKEIKEILGKAFKRAIENEDCKKTFEKMNRPSFYIPPEEAGPWLKVIADSYKKAAAKIGVKPE